MIEKELIDMRRLKDVLTGSEGEVVLGALKNYMVLLSVQSAANPEWIKGIGMAVQHLVDTPDRLEQLKQSIGI